MRARAATLGDLEDVFRGLSKRMSDEYVAAGKDSKIVYDNLMMNLKEGRAHALVEGDKTVAIIAWHENSDAADTLFAAQEDFFRAATVRFCKRHIRHIQALAGTSLSTRAAGSRDRMSQDGLASSAMSSAAKRTAPLCSSCRRLASAKEPWLVKIFTPYRKRRLHLAIAHTNSSMRVTVFGSRRLCSAAF